MSAPPESPCRYPRNTGSLAEGPISQIEDGDVVIIDAELGLLEVEAELANRDFKLQTVRA